VSPDSAVAIIEAASAYRVGGSVISKDRSVSE
jgi:hypothetical protein